MANVPTDEREIVAEPEVSTGEIRLAILERIPDEPHITRDIRIHDGIADISLRWRTLRFSTSMAVQNMTPAEIADHVECQFKEWAERTVKNMTDTNRHAMPVAEMAQWLSEAA